MWVSGSKFWTCGASTSTITVKGAMAHYTYMVQRPAPYDGVHWNVQCISQLLLKQLQINLFRYFSLVRNFKFTTSFHSTALIGMLECNFKQMCFHQCLIWIKLVVLISILFYRYQFFNQFLQGINIDWVVIFQLVVM